MLMQAAQDFYAVAKSLACQLGAFTSTAAGEQFAALALPCT